MDDCRLFGEDLLIPINQFVVHAKSLLEHFLCERGWIHVFFDALLALRSLERINRPILNLLYFFLDLASSELGNLRTFELLQTLADGLLTHMGHSHYLACASFEAKHSRSDQDGRATYSTGSSPGGHPCSVHRLQEACGQLLDLDLLVPELEARAEPPDEEAGVNQALLLLNEALNDQVLVHLSKCVHVGLDCL